MERIAARGAGDAPTPEELLLRRTLDSDLRDAIEDQEGTAGWSQQLFLLGKSGEDENQTPLDDAEVIEGECSVAPPACSAHMWW